MIMIFS